MAAKKQFVLRCILNEDVVEVEEDQKDLVSGWNLVKLKVSRHLKSYSYAAKCRSRSNSSFL